MRVALHVYSATLALNNPRSYTKPSIGLRELSILIPEKEIMAQIPSDILPPSITMQSKVWIPCLYDRGLHIGTGYSVP